MRNLKKKHKQEVHQKIFSKVIQAVRLKTIKVRIINSSTSQNYTFNKINQYISLFQAGQKLDKRIQSDRLVNYNFSLQEDHKCLPITKHAVFISKLLMEKKIIIQF